MYEFAKQWVQIAPGLTPLIALFAVLVAWRQLALNRTNQRETTAKAIFREYLKLAFEHPDFAAGNYERIVKNGKLLQYTWFVGYFLWAAEEILEYARNEAEWRENLQMQANLHRVYFNEDPDFMKTEFKTYSFQARRLIEQAIRVGQ